MVPSKRSCHKEHTCQVSKLYLYSAKVMAKVKVFVTDGQMDGRMRFNVYTLSRKRGTKNQFDIDVAYSVAIDVANDVPLVRWMEVYPFRFHQSKTLLHAEIK